MHSKKDSVLKRWHSLKASPRRCAEKWNGQYWRNVDGLRVVACRECPSFNAKKQVCSINFGSPLRKCVVSSIEAHFHDCDGESVLEIGFGRYKLAKNMIQRCGGTWTGIEPRLPQTASPELGKGGYGHVADIPFPDRCFDRVFGIQSVEHWGQKAGAVMKPTAYPDCMAEIGRVLKPGGTLYLDTVVHFHGHEMFIMGDITRIRSLLPEDQWANVQIEQWRNDCAPLEPYRPPDKVLREWPIEITTYPQDQIDEARANGLVWMMVITAKKI